MSAQDTSFSPADFSGVARLFPLPGAVLFPQVVQPLHIFEPRYKELMEDALAGDRLIAMALLEPGWEADYEGRPAVAPMACLGKIITHQQLDDGRFNLLLAGVSRIKIVRELPATRPFRLAEAKLAPDVYTQGGAAERPLLTKHLHGMFEQLLASKPQAREAFHSLLAESIPLGTLADLMAYALDAPLELKRKMLCEPDVEVRVKHLHQWLQAMGGALSESEASLFEMLRKFPPSFSDN